MRFTRTRSAVMRIGALLAAAALVGGCPQNNNGNSNGNGNANGNSNSGGNGNTNGGSRIRLKVTLDGAQNTESSMRARVWIGDRAVSRSEAANPTALQGAGFTESSLDNTNSPGDLTREFQVDRGRVVTIVALESEGADSGPLSLPAAQAPVDSLVEFVSFSGTALLNNEPGVGSLVANGDAEVFVNFRRMPQIVLWLWGASGVSFDFDIPPVLDLPARDNFHSRAFSASGFIAAPNAGVYRHLQFKSGSTVTFARIGGVLVRWEGACGGNGDECTLTFGGQNGATDQSTVLVTQYQACEFGGPTIYTGRVPGTPVDPNCTVISP
ncbi:MAG: hypothetical protein HRU75_09075 [Planctomycetia bacterium]|nr:MAG: hypothetical protein HRU75_09075 [Planctomycetia bacterium]